MTQDPTIQAACRAAAQLGRTVDRALDDASLGPAPYRLLAHLSTGSTAATMLAEKLAVSRPSVTATTDWLEQRGFVTRTRDSVDGRRVTIAITDAGQAALAEADEVVAARLAEVLGHLDGSQRAPVMEALASLLGALGNYRADQHARMTHKPAPL